MFSILQVFKCNLFLFPWYIIFLFHKTGENKSVYFKESVKIEGLTYLEMPYIYGKNGLCI